MQLRRIKYIRITLLFLLLLSSQAGADTIQTTFQKAYRLLNSGNFSEAYSMFSELYFQNINADRFLFFKAKAGYYAGSYEFSIVEFKNLIKDFPESNYKAHAYFFLGNLKFVYQVLLFSV